MKARTKPTKGRKSRQRSLAISSDALFTFNKWRVWRCDDKNIGLIHEDEGPEKTRYYSTLGAALKGLVKQVGFSCKDLDDAIALLGDLDKRITQAGL